MKIASKFRRRNVGICLRRKKKRVHSRPTHSCSCFVVGGFHREHSLRHCYRDVRGRSHTVSHGSESLKSTKKTTQMHEKRKHDAYVSSNVGHKSTCYSGITANSSTLVFFTNPKRCRLKNKTSRGGHLKKKKKRNRTSRSVRKCVHVN